MDIDDTKPAFHNNNDSDDDWPMIIKRTNSAPKQSLSSSTSKLPSSQKYDDTRGRPSLNQSTHNNGDNSSSQKSKVNINSKPSTVKFSSINSNLPSRSNHSSKNGLSSCSPRSPRTNISDNEVVAQDSKSTSPKINKGEPNSNNKGEANSNIIPKGETCVSSNKSCVQNEEDSDDERTLSAKFPSSSTAKTNEFLIKSGPSQKSKTKIKESSDDDSDDEKTLLSRVPSNFALPIKISDYEKKPSHAKQTVNVAHKRTPENANNSMESVYKKAKLSSASVTVKVNNEYAVKKEENVDDDDDDNIPISQRLKNLVPSSSRSSTKNVIKKSTSSKLKKISNMTKKNLKSSKFSKSSSVPPGSGGGKKWTTLEHNGVIFPPPYKPHGVKMLYDGKPVDLTPEQEEVATMFAVMKETDYASKPKFIENFMSDWRKILGKSHVIKKFELCDFTPIYEWHLKEKEKKKQTSLEERKAIKEEKMMQEEKYMWAVVDGVKEKVGNFRVEPPGLFRGRGEHPKMGMLKRRIQPKDITINIGKNAPIPECPIPGERWGEVRHDNTVTWLAFWNDPINPREFKYVFLAASSSLKGQSDKEKYEKARRLKDYIEDIRVTYTKNFTSKDPTKRQIAVATYLIDKLALRAGNEKDDDEAETVGCCTLKVENVTCVPPNKLQFDFLGKDSIRYYNTVEVELPVYKAIGDFQTAKKSDGTKKVGGDDLFDMLDTSKLNAHLKELMPGLTAKVFRTYNASITLDSMLNEQTRGGTLLEKITVYQRANKEVAIICNHQRSVSKSHETQMSRLNEKIDELKAQRVELNDDLNRARKGKPPLGSKRNLSSEMLEKKINQIDEKILKMETDKNNKEELKTVALGTSKINYLDPRISVAWCKRNEVPIEKIFNKSLLAKFSWAMDVEPDYRF